MLVSKLDSLDHDLSWDNKVSLKHAIYALSAAGATGQQVLSNDHKNCVKIANTALFVPKPTQDCAMMEDDENDHKNVKKMDLQDNEYSSDNTKKFIKQNDDEDVSSSSEDDDYDDGGGRRTSNSLTIDSHWTEFYNVVNGTATRRCIVCDRLLRSTDMAIDHVNSHTGLKPYQCGSCDSVFSCKRNMLAHEQKQHQIFRRRKTRRKSSWSGKKKMRHTSPKAAKSKSTWEDYEDFTSNTEESDAASNHDEHGDGPTNSLSDLIVSQPFNGKDVHVCSICKKIFASLPNALAHVQSHSSNHRQPSHNNQNQNMHQCTTCDRVFASSLALMSHRKMHNQMHRGAYKCKICHNSYKYSSTLKRHMLQQHPFTQQQQQQRRLTNIKKPRVVTTTTATSLLKNRRRKLKSDARIIPNGPTSSKFIIKKGSGRFCCTFCQEVSPSFVNALRHERIHTGERPFACSYENCTMTFIDNWSLSKHKKIHLGENIYLCPRCPESFPLQYLLKAHMQIHDDDMETDHGDDDGEDDEGVPKISMVYSLRQARGAVDGDDDDDDEDESSTVSSSGNEHESNDPLAGGVIQEDDGGWSNSEAESVDPRKGIRAHDDDTDEEDEESQDNIHNGVSVSSRRRRRRKVISKNSLPSSPLPASKCLTKKLDRDGKDVYMCKFCDKEFRFPSHARRHVRIHTGEKPFPCKFPGCDRAFINNYECVRHHQAMHSRQAESRNVSDTLTHPRMDQGGGGDDVGESDVDESESGSSDSDSWADNNVTSTYHNNSSPYVSCEVAENGSILYICNFCKKRFKVITKAVTHIRVHTGDSPYLCSCGKSFSHGSSLSRHRKLIHGQ